MSNSAYRNELCRLWLQWSNRRGTAKQIAKVIHPTDTLERMLLARGVRLPDHLTQND